MEIKPIILDTSAYSNLQRSNPKLHDYVSKNHVKVFSCFVWAELLYGFKGGNKEKKNLKILKDFLNFSEIPMVHTTDSTIHNYVSIKNNLRKNGTPISLVDIWIAAHAIEHGCQLITLDKHFLKIKNLDSWFPN